MSSSIQVITTPTADTPGTTLIWKTQKKHYVFGSQAEGTQRAMTEMGVRLIRVQDFFLTGKMEWSNSGGMIGLALTLADSASSSYETFLERQKTGKVKGGVDSPKLSVYGPPNLKHMLSTCRRFIFRKGVPILATEYKDKPLERDEAGHILPSWQDASIKVWALPVTPARKEDENDDQILAQAQKHYDESLNTFEDLQAPAEECQRDRESRYDRIRSAVLGFMFDSSWSFDTLVERHISEVEVPAAIFVRNPHTHKIEPYRGPMPGGAAPLPDIKVLTRTPWPGAKVNALPPTKPAPVCISYIVRSQDARGIFDAQRAKELGIKQGPLFGKLSRGEAVVNDKGETITSDMVIGPDKLGQGVAILDVPSLDYFEAVIQREELQSEHIMNGINAIFWILGPGLSEHHVFQQFLQKMDKLQHIISSVDTCANGVAFDSVAGQTVRLANIDPARYSVPYFDHATLPQNSLHGRESSASGGVPKNATAAARGMSYYLMPKWRKKDEPVPYDSEFALKCTKAMDPEVLADAKIAQQAVQQDTKALQAWRKLLARPDTEVITLGTGSALPSKYRNVSATLLRVPGVGNYLFDCGENTLGQLQRVFPPEELVDVIKNLRMIWISHLHADHHLGTAGVIKAWYKLRHNGIPLGWRPKMGSIASKMSSYGLSVVSHEGMIKWLMEYSSIEDFGYSRILPLEIQEVQNHADTGSKLILTGGSRLQNNEKWMLQPEDYEAVLGLSDIQACGVRHCQGAMAVSLTFPRSPSDPEDVKPLKVSYSGDCRPSRHFARIGHNTTVLIHEATFDDELRGDAIAKKHSTTSEALDIGAQMDAKAVILTHFSQRYQKIPVLETIQDGEQDSGPAPMEDVQEDEAAEDDGPADNMDVHTSTATVQHSSSSAVVSNPPRPSATHTLEQVIKIRAKDMKVGVAFDYMRVKIGDIAQLEKFNDALNRLLVKEDGDDEGAEVEGEEVVVNKNGKKTSGDEAGGKKKKSKRGN